MLAWRKYESKVLDKFKNEFPYADLKLNQKVLGTQSKTLRQVDILIKGSILGKDILGAIECKYLNKKIDIKVVDAFIGFLQDIEGNVGFIITNKGYSKGAKSRLNNSIDIRVIDFEGIDSYHFAWDECEFCSANGYYPREVLWQSEKKVTCNREKIEIESGHCSYCDTIHIKCSKCGHIIGIGDGDYGEIRDCLCGNEFIVATEYAGSGTNNDVFYLMCKNKKVEFSDKVIIGKLMGDL
jgi:hypothetical protein